MRNVYSFSMYYIKGVDTNSTDLSKVAGFDLDGTIVSTKSKAKFFKDSDDYSFMEGAIESLKRIQKDYVIVIFTNQAYKGVKANQSRKRIENILDELNSLSVCPWLFCATQKDNYRKPETGMWDEMEKYIKCDRTLSFYVGDAAGRKGDFSDSDLEFAKNLTIPFSTPEGFYNLEQK